jgi:hypothetical protein
MSGSPMLSRVPGIPTMGLIATISEAVSPPTILADRMRMSILADELRRCEYTLSNCARRLGVFPRLGVNFWPMLRREWNLTKPTR